MFPGADFPKWLIENLVFPSFFSVSVRPLCVLHFLIYKQFHILLPWWTASIVLFKCDVHLYICGFFSWESFFAVDCHHAVCNIMPSVTSFVSKSYHTLSQFLLVWFPNPLAAGDQMGTLSQVLPDDLLVEEKELILIYNACKATIALTTDSIVM